MKRHIRNSRRLGGMLVLAALSTPTFAAFPSKPIELIVPFSPGGGSDVSARIFSSCLAKQLPVKVLVKNVTGARGIIAQVQVRNARPTGYELLWAHQGMDMGKATGRADFNYQTFEPVASSVVMNYGIFAGKGSGIDNVKSLKQAVVKSPGKYNIGVAIDGFSQYAALDFLDNAGVNPKKLNTIPMSGDKTRIVATIQGNLSLVPTAVAAAAPYVKSGDINPVAILSKKSVASLPKAKTAEQQGVDSHFSMFFTTYAPKGTPEKRVQMLAEAWKKAANDPACQKQLAQRSMSVDAQSGAELNKTLKANYARILDLTKKFHMGTH